MTNQTNEELRAKILKEALVKYDSETGFNITIGIETIMRLFQSHTNKAISDVLDRLLHNSKRPICLCDTPYKNGVVSVDAIQQERNKLKGDK